MSLSLRLNLVAIVIFIFLLVLVVQSTVKTSVHYVQQQQHLGLELAGQVIEAKIKLLQTYPFIEVRPEKLAELFKVDRISDSKYLIIELFDYRGELVATNSKQYGHSSQLQSLWSHRFLVSLFKPIEEVEMDLVVSNQFLARVVLRPDREAELSDVWSESVEKLIPVFAITLVIALAIMIFISIVIRPVIDFIRSVSQDSSEKNASNFSQVRTLLGLSKQLQGIDNELKSSTSKVAHLNNRLLNLQEEERRRISAELHDELGQHLTAIRFESAAINSARNMNEIKQSAAAIDQIGREMKDIIRSMLIRLRPPELEQLGLFGALNEMMADWRIRNPLCELAFHSECESENLSLDSQHNIYRLVQEALTNISKHAGSGTINVKVSIIERKSNIEITVSDDGAGVDLAIPSKGYGIKGMKERVESTGGEIMFESTPGAGMTIKVFMPIQNEE